MKVVVYGSRVPGSKKVMGDQSRIFQILDDEFSADKKYMLDKSGKSDIPQIFVNDEYKGVIDKCINDQNCEELEEMNEDGKSALIAWLEK